MPKKEPGKYRLIHDLSYSEHGSVNDFIDPADAVVAYESLDDVVSLVQAFGAGALIAKVDIETAFRIIPIHPADRHLLGFSFDGGFYFDKCLPMGCRTSCSIFEKFSTAVQWIALNRLHIPAITHILDDFIIVGPPLSTVAQSALDIFLSFCQECGIPIKTSKTVLPTTCAVAHGILIDTVAMQTRLPIDKVVRVRELLSSFIPRRSVKLRDMQSLLGLLNFACRVIVPGRPFLRRLINCTLGVSQPHHHVTLSAGAQADLKAWLLFLDSFNGVSILPDPFFSDSDVLKLYSDAAGSRGFAAVFGSHWFSGGWPASWPTVHITLQELFPITLILEIWGPLLVGKRVFFHSDNLAVVHIVNRQTAKDPLTMVLVRRLVVAAMTHNVIFKARHIPGFSNVVADNLSRFSFQEAFAVAPWLDRTPTSIPPHLLLINSPR
ncbi:MAG: reverse transcriptase domain-containing protein [Kangiellaceae bacterium]|nr:reverse transcriptase domain-containing protein [Kangiellaceae bacterium]